MLIALDYDDTFTRDPELWLDFCKRARLKGHQVVLATMRSEIEKYDMDPRVFEATDFAVFTAAQAKRRFLAARSIYPHIWIDDRPEWIVGDAF